jgi:site-specific DNA-cytosine methylase
MKLGSLFSGCGGMDLGLEKAGMECIWQVEKMPFALSILQRHWPKVPKHTDISTFCVEDGHVRTIQSLAHEKVIKAKEVACSLNTDVSSNYSDLDGLSQKMFPDFSLSTVAKISGGSYPTWIRSGIAYHGMCWTPRTLALHNNEKELSLLEVLETSVPQKYYLSKKATIGIIRRAQKDGRSAHVLLQEQDKRGERRLRRFSLQLSELQKVVKGLRDISLTQLQQDNVELKDGQGREIILRKLTPLEKERLQGFPMNWTHPEGLSLVMQLR